MKRFLALLLVACMALSMVACGSKEEAAEANFAEQIMTEFKNLAEDGTYVTAIDMATALSKHETLDFDTEAREVEPGYLNGFTTEIGGFKEGALFGPMINSIPFVGYVFILEDGADGQEFVDNLMEVSDLNWNICTCADFKIGDYVGNMVCFIMAKTEPEEIVE